MTEPTTIPEDFDLLDYITSGTVARREVILYADDEAGQELLAAMGALESLGWTEDGATRDGDDATRSERSLAGDGAEIEELKARALAAQERLDASRSVWTVQALSSEESSEILESLPLPTMPVPPKESAGDRERARYQKQFLEYRKAAERVEKEQQYALLARSIVSVERPSGITTGVTLEHIRALGARPGGELWFKKLWAGLNEAQVSDPDVPRPTWLGRSASFPA